MEENRRAAMDSCVSDLLSKPCMEPELFQKTRKSRQCHGDLKLKQGTRTPDAWQPVAEVQGQTLPNGHGSVESERY